MKNCIATVVTATFVPGTLTMLHSFLKHNNWFDGDIVLIHDGLGVEACHLFEVCFGSKIKWHLVSDEMNQTLVNLVKENDKLAKTYKRFYSLELFQFEQYEKVLFCDSDLLFQASIQELFGKSDSLICCGDGPFYHGDVRDADTFERQLAKHASQSAFRSTFNAGFLLIDKELISKEIYQELLIFLEPKNWQKLIPAKLHDQAILNIYFSGQQSIVSCSYNYLLLHRNIMHKKTSVPLSQAKVLHFNGPAKPWIIDRTLSASVKDPALINTFESWFAAYTEMLQQLALRNKLHQGDLK